MQTVQKTDQACCLKGGEHESLDPACALFKVEGPHPHVRDPEDPLFLVKSE